MRTRLSEIAPEVEKLAQLCIGNGKINPELYEKYDVKRGLRDISGKGVVAGLTEISEIYASKIIDECGLRGYGTGDAKVSHKHTGFLINDGNATYREFMKLVKEVQDHVFSKTGKRLECEIKIFD